MQEGGTMADLALQKAKIKVYREPVEEIFCMFNPSEYKISESAGYSDKKKVKADATDRQYTGGYQSSLSLTLYYDLTENMENLSDGEKSGASIKEYTSRIAGLLLMEGSLHKPPLVEFIWGDLAYKGMLTSLNQDFTYFGMDGKPLRAKLDLTISGSVAETAHMASPKESPDRTKHRMVTQGTTLWRLAWDEYGDCEMWKQIAQFNELMNPLDIKPGQILKLPAWKEGDNYEHSRTGGSGKNRGE